MIGDRVLGAIGDEELDAQVFAIDNRDCAIPESVRMVSTFEGWGMPIAFVADDALHEAPEIVVKEPDEGKYGEVYPEHGPRS